MKGMSIGAFEMKEASTIGMTNHVRLCYRQVFAFEVSTGDAKALRHWISLVHSANKSSGLRTNWQSLNAHLVNRGNYTAIGVQGTHCDLKNSGRGPAILPGP